MTYDFIVEPKLNGLRFDSYQGVQERSPVVGYLISMQSTQGAAAYFFPDGGSGPKPDEHALSKRPNQTRGYTYSEVTHYDSLDNLDGDPQANVTYVAYSDLYDGFPSQFTGAVCYGAGTRLRTIQGEIAIEDFSIGDLLWTIDAGSNRLSGLTNTPYPQRNWRINPICGPFDYGHMPWVTTNPNAI